MTHETLILKCNQLHAEIEKVAQRKKQWTSETKPRIDKILLEVTKAPTPLQLNARIIYSYLSGLGLGSRPVFLGSKSGVLSGGHLLYSQSFSGRIHAFIEYPYCEDIVARLDSVALGVFEPAEISNEIVFGHVGKFLDAMLEWEGSTLDRQIGFQIKSGDHNMENRTT